MNYGQLKTLAKNQLIVGSTEQQMVAIINQEINNAQRALLQYLYSVYQDDLMELTRFCDSTIIQPYNTVTVAGQDTYTLPANVFYVISLEIGGRQVSLIPYELIYYQQYRWTNLTSNQFMTARQAGDQLIINPTQPDGTILKAQCILDTVDMSADSDTPSIANGFHDRLAYYAAEIADGSNLPEARNQALVNRWMQGLVNNATKTH